MEFPEMKEKSMQGETRKFSAASVGLLRHFSEKFELWGVWKSGADDKEQSMLCLEKDLINTVWKNRELESAEIRLTRPFESRCSQVSSEN
jgi:hypothetical protein